MVSFFMLLPQEGEEPPLVAGHTQQEIKQTESKTFVCLEKKKQTNQETKPQTSNLQVNGSVVIFTKIVC